MDGVTYCRVRDITNLLIKNNILIANWKEFYYNLCSEDKCHQIEIRYVQNLHQSYSLISDIVQQWVTEKGRAATVNALGVVLKEMCHIECYETLMSAFNPSMQIVNMIPRPNASTGNLPTSSDITGGPFPAQTKRLEGTKIYYIDSHDSIIARSDTSTVYQGFYGDELKKAAVKKIGSPYFRIFENELKTWKELQMEICTTENVFVVYLYDWAIETVKEEKNYYFCMEQAKCNLNQRIIEIKSSLKEPENPQRYITTMLYQVAQGLSWLHTKDIVHRDIKPHNILIFDTSSGEIAKIGDFGTCRKIFTSRAESNSIGTIGWMAPEAIIAYNDNKYYKTTKAIDIYSFGKTCQYCIWHCISDKGSHIYEQGSLQHESNTAENIEDDQVGSLQLEMPVADHLFQWMMNKLPGDRPNICHVLEHPFFWELTKSLHFLIDFAKAIDPINNEIKMYHKEIEDGLNANMSLNLDWQSKIDVDVLRWIFQRKSNPKNPKKYDTMSVTSLVILIRDKHTHYGDLVNDIIEEKYFGARDNDDELCTFSEEKYAQYFVSKFQQDVLMYLYKFAGSKGARSPQGCLKSLVKKYKISLRLE